MCLTQDRKDNIGKLKETPSWESVVLVRRLYFCRYKELRSDRRSIRNRRFAHAHSLPVRNHVNEILCPTLVRHFCAKRPHTRTNNRYTKRRRERLNGPFWQQTVRQKKKKNGWMTRHQEQRNVLKKKKFSTCAKVSPLVSSTSKWYTVGVAIHI